MKLLIVTQIVDRNDPVLSFFHHWIEELSKRVESVNVICLKAGDYDLPLNVRVYSLGKENGPKSRSEYATHFLKLTWQLRHDYDTVLVHMNQEYILIAGWLWFLMRKRVYMWRNHYVGSWLTDVAAFWCRKIFYTSRFSYTARYRNAVRMPVGVDTERFSPDDHIARTKNSILFLSRISPSKRLEIFIGALKIIKDKGVSFSASIYGDALPQDQSYYESLKERIKTYGLEEVAVKPGVPNTAAPNIFRAHEIFVNCSKSGMFDKTIFEAAASGCLPLTSSEDFRSLAGPMFYFDGTASALAVHLETLLTLSTGAAATATQEVERIAQVHSLHALGDALIAALR